MLNQAQRQAPSPGSTRGNRISVSLCASQDIGRELGDERRLGDAVSWPDTFDLEIPRDLFEIYDNGF